MTNNKIVDDVIRSSEPNKDDYNQEIYDFESIS